MKYNHSTVEFKISDKISFFCNTFDKNLMNVKLVEINTFLECIFAEYFRKGIKVQSQCTLQLC